MSYLKKKTNPSNIASLKEGSELQGAPVRLQLWRPLSSAHLLTATAAPIWEKGPITRLALEAAARKPVLRTRKPPSLPAPAGLTSETEAVNQSG